MKENSILDNPKNLNINDYSGRPTLNSLFNFKNEKIKEKKEIKKEDFYQNNDINEIRVIEPLKIECKCNYYPILIVIIFFLLNFINGMHWVTFASCAAKFGKFYHLSNLEVDILSLIFMGVYLITSWFCSWFIDKKSMRWGLFISAILLILGSILKIFINTSIAFAYIGQIISALFQPAILNSPAKIAATWFNEKRRVLVTSICCLSNTIGVMFGYIFHTFIIEDNTVNPRIFKNDFRLYLILEFAITSIFCLFFIIFMREKPTNPPSNSQKNIKTNQNKSTCQEIGKLLCDKNFRYLFISLSCIVGFINIIATIFNSYMAMYKITDSQASYISGIANVFGIITSIGVAIIIDKTIDKTKVYTKILLYCNIISILLYIVTTIILEKVKSKSLYIIIGVLFTLIIGSAVPIYTSGMDLVCEITYPIGESTSDGVIMIGNQFLGIVGIIITALLRTFLKNIKYLSNIFCILLFSISLCCLFLLHRADYQLKRSKQDQNENLLEGQNIFDDN